MTIMSVEQKNACQRRNLVACPFMSGRVIGNPQTLRGEAAQRLARLQ